MDHPNSPHHRSPHQSLTDVNDSVLIVIDVQQCFLDKLPPSVSQPLVNRISWMVRAAAKLEVPIIATAEKIEENGPNVDAVGGYFPEGTRELNKLSFGLAGEPQILSAVRETGRKTAVLLGLETDVCVMQSALGLQQEGFRVVVLSDATASPAPCHGAGILRMQNAGIIISTVKGTFYEWVRRVDTAVTKLGPELLDTDKLPDIYL